MAMVYHKKRQHKVILEWENRFRPKLKSMHGNHWRGIFHRLMKKSSTLKTTLKRRSKEYEVIFDMSLKEIRDIIHNAYGKKCKYCDSKLTVNNMVCDHIIPLSLGGDSAFNNLQMICDRCNRRKGPLTDKQYGCLLSWLSKQSPLMADYILRKMSKADVMA